MPTNERMPIGVSPPSLFRRHSIAQQPEGRALHPPLRPTRLRALSLYARVESAPFLRDKPVGHVRNETAGEPRRCLFQSIASFDHAFRRQPFTACYPLSVPLFSLDSCAVFSNAIETVLVLREAFAAIINPRDQSRARKLMLTLAAVMFRNGAFYKGIDWLARSQSMGLTKGDQRFAAREYALAQGPGTRAGWGMALWQMRQGDNPLSLAQYEQSFQQLFAKELLFSVLQESLDSDGRARSVATEQQRLVVRRSYQALITLSCFIAQTVTQQTASGELMLCASWATWLCGVEALRHLLPSTYRGPNMPNMLPLCEQLTMCAPLAVRAWATSAPHLTSIDAARQWFRAHRVLFQSPHDARIHRF